MSGRRQAKPNPRYRDEVPPVAKTRRPAVSPPIPFPLDWHSISQANAKLWSEDDARMFHQSYLKQHPGSIVWTKVSRAIGPGRSVADCMELYDQHRSFLNLPKEAQHPDAFLAMLADYQRCVVAACEQSIAMHNEALHKVQHGLYNGGAGTTGSGDMEGPVQGGLLGHDTDEEEVGVHGSLGSGPGGLGPGDEIGIAAQGNRSRRTPKPSARLLSSAEITPKTYKSLIRGPSSAGSREKRPLYDDDGDPDAVLSPGKRSKRQRRGQDDAGSWRHRHRDDDEAKGADALLSLAVLASSPDRVLDFAADGCEGEEGPIPSNGPDVSQLPEQQAVAHYGLRPKRGLKGYDRLHDGTVQLEELDVRAFDDRVTHSDAHEDAGTSQAGESAAGEQEKEEVQHVSSDTRKRRRKPLPEKLPPMLSPMKTMFLRKSAYHKAPAQVSNAPEYPSTTDAAQENEAARRFRHCLSSKLRRWCMYEFMYSAIDRPWCLQNKLLTYLSEVGLGRITSLTRGEWRLLKGAFGTPRRLSLKFLRDERTQLEQWREEAREAYRELAKGHISQLPLHVPRQVAVSQKVMARHPNTRQLHDGQILTVEPHAYRVQFLRRELGVEMVHDVDVMPINPLECLPQKLLYPPNGKLLLNGHIWFPDRPRGRDWGAHSKREEGYSRMALVNSISDVGADLERKEALMSHLRSMNDEAEIGNVLPSSAAVDAFKHEYANAVLTLKQVNNDLEGSLLRLETGLTASCTPDELVSKALEAAQNLVRKRHDVIRSTPEPSTTAAAEGSHGGDEHTEGSTQGHSVQASDEQTGQALADVKDEGPGPGHEGPPSARGEEVAGTQPQGASPEKGRAVHAAAASAQDHATHESRSALPSGMEPLPSDWQLVSSMHPELPSQNNDPDSEHADGKQEQSDGSKLQDVITGCVATFVVLQQVVRDDLPGELLADALDSALKVVQPRAPRNKPMYQQIQQSILQLKQQLVL